MAPKGGGAIVPTAKLVDLTGSPPFHQNGNGNGVVKRNGVNHHHHQQHHHHDNDPGSSGSSTSTLTGQRGLIPLTIKQLEIEFHFHVKLQKKNHFTFSRSYTFDHKTIRSRFKAENIISRGCSRSCKC